MRDQIFALDSVKNNIRQFGGNPDNVTIPGESAGSLSVSLVQASPLATGLFHRVIGESGAAFQPMWFRDKATAYATSTQTQGGTFAQVLAGEGGDTSLSALRGLSEEHVLAVFQCKPEFSNYASLAIVDGEVIPDEVATIFAEDRQAELRIGRMDLIERAWVQRRQVP